MVFSEVFFKNCAQVHKTMRVVCTSTSRHRRSKAGQRNYVQLVQRATCNYYLDTLFPAFSPLFPRFFNKLLIMPGGTWWGLVGPWGCLVGPGGTSWDPGDAWWDTCGTF